MLFLSFLEGLFICNDWQMDRMQYRWTQGVKTVFTQCDATQFPDLYLSEEVKLKCLFYRISEQAIPRLGLVLWLNIQVINFSGPPLPAQVHNSKFLHQSYIRMQCPVLAIMLRGRK